MNRPRFSDWPVLRQRLLSGVDLTAQAVLVGTARQATSRVRFGRRAVLKERVLTVSVRRKEFFLEQVDLAAAPQASQDQEAATVPRELADEIVIELREEQPVVTTTLVPRERVTVHVDTGVQDRQVSTRSAREAVEVTGDALPADLG